MDGCEGVDRKLDDASEPAITLFITANAWGGRKSFRGLPWLEEEEDIRGELSREQGIGCVGRFVF